MQFTDICLLTDDVPRLVQFYEALFGTEARGDSIHAGLPAAGLLLLICSKAAARQDMGFEFRAPVGTGRFTLGFSVDDVDAEYDRIRAMGVRFVHPPTTWPWGTRSMHFYDPDGNIVGFRSLPPLSERPVVPLQ